MRCGGESLGSAKLKTKQKKVRNEMFEALVAYKEEVSFVASHELESVYCCKPNVFVYFLCVTSMEIAMFQIDSRMRKGFVWVCGSGIRGDEKLH